MNIRWTLGLAAALCTSACTPAEMNGGVLPSSETDSSTTGASGSSSTGQSSESSDTGAGDSTSSSSGAEEQITESAGEYMDEAELLCTSACLDGDDCDWGTDCGALLKQAEPEKGEDIPNEATGLDDDNQATLDCISQELDAGNAVTFDTLYSHEFFQTRRGVKISADGLVIVEIVGFSDTCSEPERLTFFGPPNVEPTSCFSLEPLDAFFCAYDLPLFDAAWTCLDDDQCD